MEVDDANEWNVETSDPELEGFLDGRYETDLWEFFHLELREQSFARCLQFLPGIPLVVVERNVLDGSPRVEEVLRWIALLVEHVCQRLMNRLAKYQSGGRHAWPKPFDVVEAILFRTGEISADAGMRDVDRFAFGGSLVLFNEQAGDHVALHSGVGSAPEAADRC